MRVGRTGKDDVRRAVEVPHLDRKIPVRQRCPFDVQAYTTPFPDRSDAVPCLQTGPQTWWVEKPCCTARLRILHVVAPGETGGLERVVQSLAMGHQRRGLDLHVAAVLDPPTPWHPFLSPFVGTGVSVHALPLPPRAYRQERAAIRELIARERPDVVHTHGYRPDVVDAGIARRMGVASVTTVHGFTGGGWRNRLYESLQRRAYRHFDAVIAVSRPLREQLVAHGVPDRRVHLVRNAWGGGTPPLPRDEARAVLGLDPDGWVIGWVGRLSREKGADLLVEALPRLDDAAVVASFLGDGPLRHELREQAATRGAEERVRWHGTVADAGRLFPAFDVFVLSSRTEGTPIALFEAMAADVPVVATRVGGVPDVVSEGEALLVPPDNPAALAAALATVRKDPRAARERAVRARRRLECEFGSEGWLRGYEMIYEGVLGKTRAKVTV
jgi:glycosyltransferase involved in cell wall biosynthesis